MYLNEVVSMDKEKTAREYNMQRQKTWERIKGQAQVILKQASLQNRDISADASIKYIDTMKKKKSNKNITEFKKRLAVLCSLVVIFYEVPLL